MNAEMEKMLNIMNNSDKDTKILYIKELINDLEKKNNLLENYQENLLLISSDTHTRISCRKCDKIFTFEDDEIWNKITNDNNIITEDVVWNFYGNNKKAILKKIDMDNFECNCSLCE